VGNAAPFQRVRLRLGQDDFTAERLVPVPAPDLAGLALIEAAVHAAFATLPARLVFPDADPDAGELMHYLELRNPADETRYAEDTYLRGPVWLADLVLAAELVPAATRWLRDTDIVRVRVPFTAQTLRMTAAEARAAGFVFYDDGAR